MAHPVPRKEHDRTIVVKLTPDAVVVEYRLEVDDWTVVFIDLPVIDDKVDLKKLSKPREFHEAFTAGYAPIFADNLTATLDGQPLTFTCVKHEHQVIDHLRCDFVFKAPWKLTPGVAHQFRFFEGNYELEPGAIRLSLFAEAGIGLTDSVVPDEALKNRPSIDLKPGDEAKLRKASAIVQLGDAQPSVPPPPSEAAPESDPWSIRALLDSQHGFLALLGLALVFGAAHALTPGHGKTLVAAYLVGERGTVWHAMLLGLVVTITHTGSVLILAAVLPLVFPDAVPQQVESVLKLVGGLLIAGLGLWLLLRRLAGQADHVHLPGTGHHHHAPPSGPVGWWGLIVLGISGGIVPCWDAVVMLGFAILARQLWLGLPLLVAFSAGLAMVLILIGIAVVSAKSAVQKRWGESPGLARLFKLLPIFSAIAVMILGFWLCRDSLPNWGQPPPAPIQQPQE